jgi:hypothetical protein
MSLADAIRGRVDWTLHGSVARFAPPVGGWSARITPVRIAGRSLDRYHVSIIDPTGVARYTSMASTTGEALRIAESRVRYRAGS